MEAPSATRAPRVDERLVPPEGRQEIVRGRVVHALPANAPHGDRHHALDYVVRGSLAAGYVGSTDLLTRLTPGSDFATDACIRKEGIDPATGRRWLEELAFEVVAEQSVADVTTRARDLIGRGVRRVFAIFVKTNEVHEWSRADDDWRRLDPDDSIDDPTLVRPLPVRALLDAAEADRAVVQALTAKRSPAIVELEEASYERGAKERSRKAIEALCRVLDIPLDSARTAELDRLDATGLDALHDRVVADRRWP